MFDRTGFAGSGMDTLTVAVLEARMGRFFESCAASSIDELFTGLEHWVSAEGARGCLFLRAQGEAGEDPAIAEVVARYRHRLREMLARIVAVELGREPAAAPAAAESALTTAVLILLEGATSAASYLGAEAISSARSSASTLLDRVRAEH